MLLSRARPDAWVMGEALPKRPFLVGMMRPWSIWARRLTDRNKNDMVMTNGFNSIIDGYCFRVNGVGEGIKVGDTLKTDFRWRDYG